MVTPELAHSSLKRNLNSHVLMRCYTEGYVVRPMPPHENLLDYKCDTIVSSERIASYTNLACEVVANQVAMMTQIFARTLYLQQTLHMYGLFARN